MSFQRMHRDDLKKLAGDFAVDVAADANKDQIIAALAENGVVWKDVKKFLAGADEAETPTDNPAAIEPVAKAPKTLDDHLLVKMTRQNPSYEIRGVRFTRQHPFALMSTGDADWVFANVEGFRLANPEEVRSYYN